MAENIGHDDTFLVQPLREVLSLVRERGPLEVRLDDEVYLISRTSEELPKEGREFLMKGGPAT